MIGPKNCRESPSWCFP